MANGELRGFYKTSNVSPSLDSYLKVEMVFFIIILIVQIRNKRRTHFHNPSLRFPTKFLAKFPKKFPAKFLTKFPTKFLTKLLAKFAIKFQRKFPIKFPIKFPFRQLRHRTLLPDIRPTTDFLRSERCSQQSGNCK
jgi:hypothetical protein